MALAGLLILVSCSGPPSGAGRPSAADPTTSSRRAPTTVEPAATTSAPSAASTPGTASAPNRPVRSTTTAPAVGYPTAQEAATHLLRAWSAADRIAARQGTDPAAITSMFAVPLGPLVDRGCDTGEFTTSGCQYRLAGGGLQLNMEKRPVGWVVAEARFSP